jgi:hypothetical protein
MRVKRRREYTAASLPGSPQTLQGGFPPDTAIVAVIAIVLAAAGLQALTMYWVQAARKEPGIRRAIGASHRDVLTWFERRWAVVPGTGGPYPYLLRE